MEGIQRKSTLIQERYEQGQALFQQHSFDKAIPVFESCHALAAQHQLPLLIDQHIDITLSIGFCYANIHNWDKALEIYHTLERTIKQEGLWYESLPSGLMVAFPESFEPSIPLAVLYDSIAVAYDNSNHRDRAISYYEYAIETYEKAGLLERASQTWYFRGVGSQRREDWMTLQVVGEKMLLITRKLEDTNGQVAALHFLIQAHVNQRDLHRAAEYLRQVVEVEKLSRHPDLAQDEALYEELAAHLSQTQITNEAKSGKEKSMELTDLDSRINSLQDAIQVSLAIYEEARVTPEEMKALIKQGTVGPNLRRARQIADTSRKLHAYADQVAMRDDGRSFEELVPTGEAQLVLLCCDVTMTSDPSSLDSSWQGIRSAIRSKTTQRPARKWWEFWKR